MRRIRTIRGLFAAGVLAVAAAGPSAAGASSGAHEDAHRAAAGRTIVQTADAAGKFRTLTALLRQAGLVRTLQGDGPYTVFAPTDAAFAKVPSATLERLGGSRAKLRSVLLHHVARGRLTAAKVVRRPSISTLDGQRVRVRLRDGSVLVGGARVVTPDVTASNGVIHAIDKVLLPR